MAVISERTNPSGFSFGKAISTALHGVFKRPGRFLKLALIPFLLALGLAVAKVPATVNLPGSDLAFLFLDVIPYTLLAIAISRVILPQENAGYLPQPVFGRRTWIYFGYSLLMLVTMIVAGVVLVALDFIATELITSLGQPFDFTPLVIVVLGGIGIALVYVMARLSLVFPAVAVDQKLGLLGAWRLSRGSGLKLFGLLIILFVIMIVFALVGSMILGTDFNINIGGGAEVLPGATASEMLATNAVSVVWGTLVSLVGSALIAAAFAFAYAQLSGWGGPRQEILERFE